MFKKYLEAMRRMLNDDMDRYSYVDTCIYTIYMTLEKRVPKADIESMDVVDVITVAEQINIIMRDVVMKKINDYFAQEVIEQESSAFDDYDRENGYLENEQDDAWTGCIKLVNSLIRMAIKIFNDSFSSILKADIIELIEQVKYELDALEDEKDRGESFNGRS